MKEEAASRMAFFQIGAAGHQGSKLPYIIYKQVNNLTLTSKLP